MNSLKHLIPIAIPITATDRTQAQNFAEQQPKSRAEQVYHNTLAVLATRRYLQLLGINADLTASQSWNPLDRLLENSADLYIPDVKGHLECRPVRQGDRTCIIPEEVWSERLGYVVVQLDEPYREAQVLGFVPSVSVSELPLSALQPLDVLIDCLVEPIPEPVRLTQWLKEKVESGWQPLKDLLRSPRKPILIFAEPKRDRATPEMIQKRVEQLYRRESGNLTQCAPANLTPQEAIAQLIQTTQDDEIRWQAAELLWELDPQHSACPVINVKDVGLYLTGHSLALMVGLLPKQDGKLLILLRVYPMEQPHLPSGLKLVGLDETGNAFFELESRQRDNYMQFKFTADAGDRFSVRVVLNDAAFTENFEV